MTLYDIATTSKTQLPYASCRVLVANLNRYLHKVAKCPDEEKFDTNTQSDSHEFLIDLIAALKENKNEEMMKNYFDMTVEESLSCCCYDPPKKLQVIESQFLLEISDPQTIDQSLKQKFAIEKIPEFKCVCGTK